MSDTQILLYNFKEPERLRAIRRYLNQAHIQVQLVSAPDFSETLGYLFELPGYSKSTAFGLGGNFSEEMMVLKDFSQEQLNDFLAFFHENHLEPVALKAILTPITCHWTSLQLHDELVKEHKEMSKR